MGNVITSKTIWRRLWFKESKRSERKWEDFLRRENELTTNYDEMNPRCGMRMHFHLLHKFVLSTSGFGGGAIRR